MTEAHSGTLEGCRCVGNTPTHHHRSSATHWEYPQLQCFLEWELVTSGLKANFNLLFYFVNKVLLNSTANQFSSTLSITGLVVQKESWIMLTETFTFWAFFFFHFLSFRKESLLLFDLKVSGLYLYAQGRFSSMHTHIHTQTYIHIYPTTRS